LARTGRRPGTGGTKERILAAARSDFGRAGYEGATIRGIAAQAKVDPALVLHYFDSKDGVFRAAIQFPLDPAEFIPKLLEPGLDELGARLTRFFVEAWDSPAGSPLIALIRSVVANQDAAALMRDFVSRQVLGRVARALDLDQPQLRASLAASQLVGLAMLRYIIRLEPIASAGTDELVAWVGPTLQRYFTDPDVTKRKKSSRRRR
jgi:AcrR family transcriptional regulator